VADGTGANPKKVFGDGDAGIHKHLPSWSLDGAWIYFTRGDIATMKWDIWRIPTSGGAAERLTRHNSLVAYPNSIDKRAVLYVARDENGLGPWLWALDVETKKYRRISSGTDEYIALSATADGRRLAATIAKPSANLRVVPILERVAEDSDVKAFEVPAQRAWAPRFSGSALAVGSSGSESLFFLSSLGSGDGLWRYRDKQVTEVWKGADGALFEPPAVSRDGEQIAIVLRRNGRPVWHIGAVDRTNFRSVGEGLDIQGSAAWSPDGRFLLAGGSDAKGQGLFRIPVDGGTPIRLVSGIALNPVWSPEGNLIVYAGASVGPTALLHAIGPDGATAKFPSIKVDGFGAQSGRFLPNGKGLIYRIGPDMRSSLFASATTATFWRVRAISCASQQLNPGACLLRYCITTRAPCTNSLRRYEFPRLLMPSNFCLPPVEYSRGTIPTHAARSFPLRKPVPLPIAATRAVAVTGPIPGIDVSRWQASFSLAVSWITIPEVMLIAGTRVALGFGVGLLISDRLNEDQRKAAGWGALWGRYHDDDPDSRGLLAKPPVA